MTKNKICFPQADSLTRLMSTVRAVRTVSTFQGISEELGVTERQARYYVSAAAYMGLVTRDGKSISTTSEGKRISRLKTERNRNTAIVGILSKRPVFSRVLNAQAAGRTVKRTTVASWIARHGKLATSTAMRRAVTVQNWVSTVSPSR